MRAGSMTSAKPVMLLSRHREHGLRASGCPRMCIQLRRRSGAGNLN